MKPEFKSQSFSTRLTSMLKVDFRRMFTMPLFYLMSGICFAIPVLTLVMTTMFMGESADPAAETAMVTFTNVWQAIGSTSDAGMSMDLTTMSNINMMYFLAAVLVCLFVAEDFRSGYAKNLFTVRSKKSDYVISKTAVGFVSCVGLLLCYFAGAMIGGAIAGLSFDLGTVSVGGIIMCMLAKIFLMGVFVSIYLIVSVAGKHRAWLSILGSLMAGMLLYMMIPMMTPLDATFIHAGMCLAGGVLFSIGLGAVSNLILNKTSLV